MKKYYIDKFITYCYPYDIKRVTKNYGVLSKYMGRYFDRNEMDKIICELIMKHPYIENSMMLEISIMQKDERTIKFYHSLNFINDNYQKQNKESLEIKYENMETQTK